MQQQIRSAIMDLWKDRDRAKRYRSTLLSDNKAHFLRGEMSMYQENCKQIATITVLINGITKEVERLHAKAAGIEE